MSNSFWKSFGPGVLFAGAAIGTSHLVQSTRAGAVYGLGLLGIVVATNVIKYPAYRFGPEYAAATGKSLIDGYRELGRWVVGFYLVSEIVVMPIIIAATGLVTAAILLAVTGIDWPATQLGVILIAMAALMLAVGGYGLLDGISKVFVAILTVTTIFATLIALPGIDWSVTQFALPTMDAATFAFVIALMGFMPAGMDLSVLQSLWSVAKGKSIGEPTVRRHALLDFNIGFVGSAALAVCFLLMGASVMHGKGVKPASGAAEFAQQVISLYTTNLGNWAGVVVGISAVAVMFTTLIVVLDGMPRLVTAALRATRGQSTIEDTGKSQLGAMVFLSIVAALVLMFFMTSFRQFIDFVTVTAFVVAPLTALLNHLVMFSGRMPRSCVPSKMYRVWSLIAIVVLSGLTIAFLYSRFLD